MGMTYKPTWKTFFELGKEELRKEKYKHKETINFEDKRFINWLSFYN